MIGTHKEGVKKVSVVSFRRNLPQVPSFNCGFTPPCNAVGRGEQNLSRSDFIKARANNN